MTNSLLLSKPLTAHQCRDRVSEADFQRAMDFSEARASEYLTWRAMLYDYFGHVVDIAYNGAGAPEIVGSNLNIGVSHCVDCVAVVISEGLCAVDVERKDRDVKRISQRFITPQERELCSSEQELVALWCARECYYKLRQDRSLSMITDIHVVALDMAAEVVTVEDNRTERATFRIEQTAEHFIVYMV